MYLNFDEAARFCRLSRPRIEQLLRDPTAKFPSPFQPGGSGAKRAFKQSELVAWMERQRAAYPQAKSAGLLLAGGNAPPLYIPSPPKTREHVLNLLRVPAILSKLPLKRHRTGLVVNAFDENHRIVEAEVFLIARAEDPDAERIRLFEIDAPAPAILVAQKSGETDFANWTGYQEPTGILAVQDDLRHLLEQAKAAEIPATDPDARYLLSHLEGAIRDVCDAASSSLGVLRVVALDVHGNIAAAGNFTPFDPRGIRDFALRAFDAMQTAYVEGVLRAPVASGSSAESAPAIEFLRWSAKPFGESPVAVKIDGKAAFYGSILDKPVAFDAKTTPVRVPIAGLPVFRPAGESKPVIWSQQT